MPGETYLNPDCIFSPSLWFGCLYLMISTHFSLRLRWLLLTLSAFLTPGQHHYHTTAFWNAPAATIQANWAGPPSPQPANCKQMITLPIISPVLHTGAYTIWTPIILKNKIRRRKSSNESNRGRKSGEKLELLYAISGNIKGFSLALMEKKLS